MRISVDESDPGFTNWNWSMAGHVHTFFNGLQVNRVITCDEEAGEIIRYVKDVNDEYVIDRERQEIIRETLRGVVKIVFDEGFEPK